MEQIKNKRIKRISKQGGFTLLETLVAIFILVLSITGPMVFAQSSLRAAFQSRDQITAFYLAQDVIEFIKNKRDTNHLTNGKKWLDDLGTCLASTCSIDTRPGNENIVACSGAFCTLGLVDVVGGIELYGHNLSAPSRFKRTVRIIEVQPNIEAQVLIEIQWENNLLSGRRRIVVEENIYNWLPTGS